MKPSKRSPRRSAEESRKRILDAALYLIARKGWVNTSFQMIADRCQVSQSNVIYHFPSKETLLAALIERISLNNYQLVGQAIRPQHNAYERICLYFEKNIDWALKYPEESQVIFFVYYQAIFDPEFSRIFRILLERAQARLYEYTLSGVRENIFDLALSPETTAKVLHNILVGAVFNLSSGRAEKIKNYSKLEWEKIIAQMTGFKGLR